MLNFLVVGFWLMNSGGVFSVRERVDKGLELNSLGTGYLLLTVFRRWVFSKCFFSS